MIEQHYRILNEIDAWKKASPAVFKRGQQILTQICKDGLSDLIELHAHFSGYNEFGFLVDSLGILALHQFGGNPSG
ncbi:hypothetical protein BLNAU_11355 [Blattamonas nauphoetae]|uniref:Transposase n=1 Tax=Blattamonas nauphoetae TaxID=2049346 RepID=A0ABQ9XRP9_9EUKA|nr:hypothetical protein BLNAU_11355 [Blattamonas nauphoetae]